MCVANCWVSRRLLENLKVGSSCVPRVDAPAEAHRHAGDEHCGQVRNDEERSQDGGDPDDLVRPRQDGSLEEAHAAKELPVALEAGGVPHVGLAQIIKKY